MEVPENMCRLTVLGEFPLRAEYSRQVLNELEHFMPADLLFKDTDHSLIACTGRTLSMCTWHAHNIGPPDIIPGPASTTEVFALYFPCVLFEKPFVRYYSVEVADMIWSYCQNVAVAYGINVSEDDVHAFLHPIHRLVEGRYYLNKKPTPLILTPPRDLLRREYPGWIEQFMRDIYQLLLDGSFRSMGTECHSLAFGFLEENALAPEAFKATAIVRPVADSGQLWADDFAVGTFRQLPNQKFAVTIQPSFRWMVNRHSNARPVRPVSMLDRLRDADEVATLICSDSYCGSVPDSQPGSVPASEAEWEPESEVAEWEPESEVNLEQIWNDISAEVHRTSREMSEVRWTTRIISSDVPRDHPGLGSWSESPGVALAAPGAPQIRRTAENVERVPAEPEADAQSEPGSEVNLSTITVLSHSRIDRY